MIRCARYLLLIGMAVFFVGRALPRRWFRADRFPFNSFFWEKNGKIYRALGVQHWKDKVPDMSRHSRKMLKKQISRRPDREQIQALIRETCVAELSHWVLILLSLPVLRFCPGIGGRAIYALCVLGNLVFVVIQRYNRPRLVRTAQRWATPEPAVYRSHCSAED